MTAPTRSDHRTKSRDARVRTRRRERLFPIRADVSRTLYLTVAVGVLVVVFAGWLTLTGLELVRPLFLPSPAAVWERGMQFAGDGTLWADASASIYRITVGFAVSCALAIPIGLAMGTFRLAEAIFEPPVGLMRYMPIVAFVPLTILWVGIADPQKFLIVFLGTFFQQVLLISDNVKAIPIDLINVGKTLGLGRLAIVRRIIAPAAAPAIWDTLRVTLGWAWTYLVVAELVAADSGLGFRIMQAQRYLQTDTIILGIIVIGFLGLVSDLLFKFARRLLFAWTT